MLWARTQDEPYAPDFLPGEWCVIHPQLREQRKWLRSVLLVDLYFPNSGKMRKLNLRELSAFILLSQYVVERNSIT